MPPDPETTRWCLTLYDAPLRKADGFSMTLSPFRRPTIETAPVDAKAGCLYPNNARAMLEARSRGFDNCLVCDMLGNVAELATSNVFMVKDGVIFTPAPNGTFLNGITRQRVIELLRADGLTVIETTLRYRDFETADEIFATNNASKVLPVTRIGERSLQPGPVFRKARALYWEFAQVDRATAESIAAPIPADCQPSLVYGRSGAAYFIAASSILATYSQLTRWSMKALR